jgi:hypothetical protein
MELNDADKIIRISNLIAFDILNCSTEKQEAELQAWRDENEEHEKLYQELTNIEEIEKNYAALSNFNER